MCGRSLAHTYQPSVDVNGLAKVGKLVLSITLSIGMDWPLLFRDTFTCCFIVVSEGSFTAKPANCAHNVVPLMI